jgi:hypothetical protein
MSLSGLGILGYHRCGGSWFGGGGDTRCCRHEGDIGIGDEDLHQLCAILWIFFEVIFIIVCIWFLVRAILIAIAIFVFLGDVVVAAALVIAFISLLSMFLVSYFSFYKFPLVFVSHFSAF